MDPTLTLSREEYSALASLAALGAVTVEQKRTLDTFLRAVETRNQITRYALRIRYKDARFFAKDPRRFNEVDFPRRWPPEYDFVYSQYDRPISRSDITSQVLSRTPQPVDILVTKDLGGLVGWTTLEGYGP